jgi:hypothetical protein
MKFFLTAALTIVAASSSFANIVNLGPAPEGGAGLGNRLTVLTLQSPANSIVETGCINASGTTTGCGFDDANALEGAGQIGSYTTGDLGLTSLADLRIMFNAAQPGNSENISLDALVLTLYNTTLNTSAAFSLANSEILQSTFLGIGNEGYMFGLDANQAAQANLFVNGNTNIVLGLGASLTGAIGGPDTFSFSKITGPGGDNTVPEPSTYMMLAGGMLALIGGKKFRKAS